MQRYEYDQFRMKSVNQAQFSQFEASFNNFEQTVINDNKMLVNIAKEQRDLEFEIDRIKDTMSKKVDFAACKRLEDKFNHYTPITKFLTLDNSIHSYALRENVDEISSKLKDLTSDVELKAYKDDLMPQFENLRLSCKTLQNECEDLRFELKTLKPELDKFKTS